MNAIILALAALSNLTEVGSNMEDPTIFNITLMLPQL